jgi:hypothetical protein
MWEPKYPSAALVLQCRAVCIPCIGHGQTVDDSLCSGKRRHALLPRTKAGTIHRDEDDALLAHDMQLFAK